MLNIKPPLGVRLRHGHPLNQGLLLDFVMNEGSGFIKDLSGNKNIGTMYGDTVWRTQNKGSCLYFPGSNDAVIVARNPQLYSLKSITVRLVFLMYETPSGTVRLVHQNGSWSVSYSSSTLGFGFATYGVPANFLNSYVIPAVNTWYEQTCVYDGDKLMRYIYVNGIKIAEDAKTGYLPASTNNLVLGLDEDLVSNDFNGLISQVSIWNRPFTPSEVQQLYIDDDSRYGEDI